MVQELADYVHNCPPDPSHFLEIHNLETLGVDLSFFPEQSLDVFPEPTQPEAAAPLKLNLLRSGLSRAWRSRKLSFRTL